MTIFENITMTQETMIDFPDKVGFMIFVRDCNLRCNYCYNIERTLHSEAMSIDDVVQPLRENPTFYNGIIINGGEPTLYEDLPMLTKFLRNEFNIPIKIDTNGYSYDTLMSAKPDYIAVDYKWPLDMYKEMTKGNYGDLRQVLKHINKTNGEIRTTIVPAHGNRYNDDYLVYEKMYYELLDIREGDNDFTWIVNKYFDCPFVFDRSSIDTSGVMLTKTLPTITSNIKELIKDLN